MSGRGGGTVVLATEAITGTSGKAAILTVCIMVRGRPLVARCSGLSSLENSLEPVFYGAKKVVLVVTVKGQCYSPSVWFRVYQFSGY